MPGPFQLYDYLTGLVPDTSLTVRLYQSGPPFTTMPVPEQFVEAEYSGYAPQLIKPGYATDLLGDGTLQVQLPNMLWKVAILEEPGCTVHGWYITTNEPLGVSRVACWGEFVPPQELQRFGDQVQTAIIFSVRKFITPASN